MKNKMMMVAAAGILTVAGFAYGFGSSESCPLEGAAECPKIDCPLAGTPECPYDKAATAELSACCQKK